MLSEDLREDQPSSTGWWAAGEILGAHTYTHQRLIFNKRKIRRFSQVPIFLILIWSLQINDCIFKVPLWHEIHSNWAYLETWELKSHQHLQFFTHVFLFDSTALHSSSPLHLLQAAFSLLTVFRFTVAALENRNAPSEHGKVFAWSENQTCRWETRENKSIEDSSKQKTRGSKSESGEWLTAAGLWHSVQMKLIWGPVSRHKSLDTSLIWILKDGSWNAPNEATQAHF